MPEHQPMALWSYEETDSLFADCWRVVARRNNDLTEIAGQVWREEHARLIAAAPLLLDAIRQAIDYHRGARSDLTHIMEMLWHAYTIAVGESSHR